MTSPSPLLYDTYYHIYNRGVNGEDIFVEERNYNLFLKLFEKHLIPVANLFAYCLLRNHFHLSVRIKSEEEILETRKTLRVSPANRHQIRRGNSANQEEGQSRKPLGSHFVSDQFSNFFNAYAKTVNKAYGRTGSLFQHPFGRIPITTDNQFWNVIAYIHQNPQKHSFVKDFRDWTPSLPPPNTTRKIRICIQSLDGCIWGRCPQDGGGMKWFGSSDDYLSLHQQWVTEAQAKWFTSDFD